MSEATAKYEVGERTIYRRGHGVTRTIIDGEVVFDAEELFAAFNTSKRSFPYTEDDRCRGIGTDLFFLEEDGLKQKGLDFTQVRSICFTCSNRQPCLDWAYETKEEFGMYGGLSANERKQILGKNYDGKFLGALKRDLEKFGVDFTEVLPKKAK